MLLLMLGLFFGAAPTEASAQPVVEDIVLLADLAPEASSVELVAPQPATVEQVQAKQDVPEDDEPFDLWVWLTGFINGLVPETVVSWLFAFLLVGETLVRLTPTETDDKWFLWVKRVIDTIFPSRKKGGGTFPKATKTPV